MANKIQIKRGLESNINKSNLLQGELAVTTDSNKLYVGTSKGPIQLNKDDESLVIIDYYETDMSLYIFLIFSIRFSVSIPFSF